MQDWTAGQLRYVVHFDDGGSGMRLRLETLNLGTEGDPGRDCYRVTRVEQPAHSRDPDRVLDALLSPNL
jgi:hypothetical protein